METKGLTCKIPLELHQQIKEEQERFGMTMNPYIEMILREHFTNQKGETDMGKSRTLAFQVSEELFGKIKEYRARYEQTHHRRLTQKEFVIGLIEQALEETTAREGEDSADSPENEATAPEGEDGADSPENEATAREGEDSADSPESEAAAHEDEDGTDDPESEATAPEGEDGADSPESEPAAPEETSAGSPYYEWMSNLQ